MAVWAAMATCTTTALTGCIAQGEQAAPEPGPAAVNVTVVRGDQTYPLTARITGWEVRPHPQTPEGTDWLHFTYRATQTGPLPVVSVEIPVCAVDAADVVLICSTLFLNEALSAYDTYQVADGDTWTSLGPDANVARVLFLPDDLHRGPHAGDPKDDDGYVPPRIPEPGERLHTL
ncbi:hypothetical protein ACFV0C_07655 [Streptomyces sp. NPDC059568]|uniref:hypothetical protein n=1 Tax=Streptomyces sp. NPDC059568 TaxID=3346868 RepID=UPI0036B14BC9